MSKVNLEEWRKKILTCNICGDQNTLDELTKHFASKHPAEFAERSKRLLKAVFGEGEEPQP